MLSPPPQLRDLPTPERGNHKFFTVFFPLFLIYFINNIYTHTMITARKRSVKRVYKERKKKALKTS
jgi:hypothetical protein